MNPTTPFSIFPRLSPIFKEAQSLKSQAQTTRQASGDQAEYRNRALHHPFGEKLGIQRASTRTEKGFASIRLCPKDAERNAHLTAHGGYSAAVLDQISAAAAESLISDHEKQIAVTSDLNVKYLGAVELNKPIEVEAEVIEGDQNSDKVTVYSTLRQNQEDKVIFLSRFAYKNKTTTLV